MRKQDSPETHRTMERSGLQEGRAPEHKISRPRLNPHVFIREDFLKYLDDQLERRSLWLAGPPGSGKTVLASSYLHSRKIPASWYQLDIIDSDPASFFSLFPQALTFRKKESPMLPRFTPETMLQFEIFCRKFFRELFQDLSEASVIVLDNYQEIGETSVVHNALDIMVEELPSELRLMILSRGRPPKTFARARAHHFLQVIEEDRLLFSRKEVGALLELHGISAGDDGLADHLYDVTRGWAAGLTLMLEELETHEGQALALPHQGVVFDYFADVVFQRQGKAEQDMLLKASVLQELDVKVVETLCQWSGTGPYLQKLSEKNYFTYRISKEQKIYQFHPLFRAFLAKTAEERFSEETLVALRRQGAELLRESGSFVESIELLFEVRDWSACTALIKENARVLFERAHFGTVLRWLSGIPEESLVSDPWLLCHKGVAAMPFLPQVSIECLQRSFQDFRAKGDIPGALFCCPHLCRAILSFMTDMSAMDPLIGFIQQHVDVKKLQRESDPRHDQLVLAMFRALVSHRPDHPEIERWAGLVENLFQKGRLVPGPVLPLHYLWAGRFAEAEDVLRRSLGMKEHMASSPLDLTGVLSLKLQYHLVTGQAEECLETVRRGLQAVEETGVKIWKNHYYLLGAACLLNQGETGRAREFIGEVEQNFAEIRGLDLSYYHLVKAFCFLLTGGKREAAYHGSRALEEGIRLRMPSYENWCRLGNGVLALDRRDYGTAIEHFERIFQRCATSSNPWFVCQAHFGTALVHLGREEKDEAIERVKKGFSLARQHGYEAFFFFPRDMLTALCALAQENIIETTFVCSFIRRWKLVPKNPCVQPESWPWPLKIYALGKFRVESNGKDLLASSGGKGKPLELLRVLISRGGNQVAETRIQDILWPDSEGDKQSRSLKTTLYRLRKLLGLKEAIIHADRSLSINRNCCWVDTFIFQELDAMVREAAAKEKSDQLVKLSGIVFNLYQGPFLSDRPDEEWAFTLRADLTRRFRSLVEALGKGLEEKKEWASADRIYQEAISRDPSWEHFYRRRMDCLYNLGENSRALRVYEECEERLAGISKKKPSFETRALRDRILSA